MNKTRRNKRRKQRREQRWKFVVACWWTKCLYMHVFPEPLVLTSGNASP